MTIIYLVRHGQASLSADNYDKLSDLGIKQAKLVGESLAKQEVKPDVVYQGSMVRHQQTAANSLPAYALDMSVNILSEWNEYNHQDILATYDERLATPQSIKAYLAEHAEPMAVLHKAFIAAINRWTSGEHDQEYQEAWPAFKARVQQGLAKVLEGDHKTVVVYTSGGPISLVSCLLLGMPLAQFMQINWTLVNGGITKLLTRGSDRKLILSSLNEHTIFNGENSKQLITYA